MFDSDKWQEIYYTISKNKLRTILTGFGVFWGIFMLVLLLGAGKGLENGTKGMFKDLAKNSIWIWGGKSSMPFNGFKPGRNISFQIEDYYALKKEVPELNYVAPGASLRGEFTVNYETKNGAFSVGGDFPDMFKIRAVNVLEGRLINMPDVTENRKVALIGTRVKELLFGSGNALGEYISIKGVFFKVIGVFEPFSASGNGGRDDSEKIFIPLTTLQKTYNILKIGSIAINPKPEFSADLVEQKVTDFLKKKYNVDPLDKSAIGSWNSGKEVAKFEGLFAGINFFVWVVGGFTIFAGIIGVSNIMLITVQERTKEIGIKKALGATPSVIIWQIVQEAIVITLFSGYFGLIAGIGVIEGIKKLIASMPAPPAFFNNPDVDIFVAMYATLLLVFTGALAGFIPARKAAMIKPIEALRSE